MADEYIKRENIRERFKAHLAASNKGTMGESYFLACLDVIDTEPAADVRPVVHGMWVRDEYGVIHCSVCNAYLKDEEYENHTFKQCYYCGADMREEVEGNG